MDLCRAIQSENRLESNEEVFEFLDSDQTGTLSPKNLKRANEIVGLGLTNAQIRDIIIEGDEDGDGTIPYHGFENMVGNEIFDFVDEVVGENSPRGYGDES